MPNVQDLGVLLPAEVGPNLAVVWHVRIDFKRTFGHDPITRYLHPSGTPFATKD